MTPQLQSLLDHIIGQARLNLEMWGSLMPVGFLVNKAGLKIIGTPFPDDEAKEAAVVLLRQTARAMNAHTFIMLCEAWTADLVDGKWDGTPAAEMPNRREVVHMYVESADEGYWIGVAPITRSNGTPTFDKIKWDPITSERLATERMQKILA